MTKKVFLIDDDVDVREVMSFALIEENYNVEAYKGADIALKEMKLLGPSQYPDLIFVDYHMPNMTGVEFIYHIKEFYPETLGRIPLVLCSAQSDLELAKTLPKEVRLLVKPMDLDELLDLAASLV